MNDEGQLAAVIRDHEPVCNIVWPPLIKTPRLGMVTPLRYAVRHSHFEAVRFFCESGADMNQMVAIPFIEDVMLLDYACWWHDNISIVEYLFERGAHFDFSRPPPRVALAMAVTWNRLKQRIFQCRSAAATLLCVHFRAGLKLPRDVAVLLARAVWLHRRRDVWEFPK